MRKIKTLIIILMILGIVFTTLSSKTKNTNDAMLSIAKKVAKKFDYYDEISASAPNLYKGKSEIGGQCGDYALDFVNRWNAKNSKKAMLVIQQQGLSDFPDGIYEVIGKDKQPLPFLINRKTSMLYVWNNVLGIGHPQLGGYKIKLVKKVYVKSHFGLKNWSSNGPHVWAVIDKTAVDPTYLDLGITPVIGKDTYQ